MPRQQQYIIIAVIGLLALAVGGWMVHRHAGTATTPPGQANPSPVTATAPPAKANAAAPPAEPAATAPVKPQEPLPPLVPGNPLTDERFAQMSSKIVIAALGLKQDADWEVNVVAYMAKVLKQEGITEEQYRQYAEALNENADRGRAVAENIVRKTEKKLGHNINMDKLPMLKFDKQNIQKLEKRLK